MSAIDTGLVERKVGEARTAQQAAASTIKSALQQLADAVKAAASSIEGEDSKCRESDEGKKLDFREKNARERKRENERAREYAVGMREHAS